MRGIKSKFDTSKPFKIVTNLQLFQSLQATDRLFPVHKPHGGEQENGKKEEIVVPKIQIVPRLTKRKAFARITPEYIRLPSYLNLPKTDIYELTEVDRLFLSGLRSKYGLDRFGIGKQFLQRVIIELQSKAGRDPVLPRSKGWIVNFLQREYKQLVQQPSFQQFATLLYNYWRSRREEMKFPIYRPLWRPAENEFNHMLAFKVRPKNSRNLRRTNRVDEADIVQELHEEYHNAALLCERIEAREEIKLRQIQLQILAFAQECKDFVEMDEEVQKMATPEIVRIDHREKVRKLRLETEEFKKRRDNTQFCDSENAHKEVVNQKETVASFLANIVYQAEKIGINHDSIFKPFQPSFPSLKHSNSFQQSRLSQQIPEPLQAPEEKLETTCFSMSRYGDMLVRSLSEQSQQFQQSPKDYFSSRHKRIAGSYFGEDDNLGEYRDLRRIISANFKRFLQLSTQP